VIEGIGKGGVFTVGGEFGTDIGKSTAGGEVDGEGYLGGIFEEFLDIFAVGGENPVSDILIGLVADFVCGGGAVKKGGWWERV